MAQRAHVPQFGNWENEDNVPYTIYFDKARKGRGGGKMINPNDPNENPDLFPNMNASSPSRAEPIMATAVARQRQPGRDRNRGESKEEGNFRQFADSPGRSYDNQGRSRTSGDHGYVHQQQNSYGHGTNSTSRASRQSIGSENSIERSPLHPHYQAKARGGSVGSPSLDGKTTFESGHGTAAGTRLRPFVAAGVDQSPDRGAAVPRFGDWDENNPQSADNFTHIFNKVREEKHGPSHAQGSKSAESTYHDLQKQNKQSKDDCCFPWFRK